MWRTRIYCSACQCSHNLRWSRVRKSKVFFFSCPLLQLCEICQEQFETYWVEEEEDWFLKNAIRVDDKVLLPFTNSRLLQ